MGLSQRRSRLLRRLAVNRSRAREGLVPVEGIRAVAEALAADASIHFAVVSPRLEGTEEGRALRERLEVRPGVDVVEISDDEMTEHADTQHPQGVLLVCSEPEVDAATALRGSRRALVLDAVRDPGNVGTLVRSAVAFSFDPVLVLDGTADPWSAKAVRASAGTVFHASVARLSADEAVEALAAEGLPIFAASAEGVAGVEPPERVAVAVGNEGAGVRQSLRDAAAAVVAVPMSGPAESLNVGIAGSILMSDFSVRAG